MQSEDIQSAFVAFAARQGYALAPPDPLLSRDPTLLFTNSTIVPHKAAILRGDRIRPCAQVQSCFRANAPEDLPYAFTMLGLLAEAAHLPRVLRDTARFLESHAFPADGRLLAIMCAEDADLMDAWNDLVDDPLMSVRFVPSVQGITRWRYGEGDRLFGRGLSMFWSAPRASTHIGCDVGCGCGRFQVLGTVIVVGNEAQGSSYVEAAFGLEGLRATRCRGEYFALPEYDQITRTLVALGRDRAGAQSFARNVLAASQLVAAGCVPASRGAGHVLRRIIRRMDATGIAALEGRGLLDPATAARIKEDLAAENNSRERRISAARRFVSARDGTVTPDDLRGTFGLTDEAVRSLLEAVESTVGR
ncbi:MAG TPA: hypothetical protein VNI54_03985 [Thermoanaerobaculia bacterium]|nr:hypothetical protein [Thermoanaerobaculia bacterium]